MRAHVHWADLGHWTMLREALETDFDAIVESKHLDHTGSKAKRSPITVHLLPSPMPSQVEDRREGILIVKPPTTSLRPALFTVCPGRSPVGTSAEKGLACPPRSGWGKQSHRLKKTDRPCASMDISVRVYLSILHIICQCRRDLEFHTALALAEGGRARTGSFIVFRDAHDNTRAAAHPTHDDSLSIGKQSLLARSLIVVFYCRPPGQR
ncbi:uncharacterized protein K489DRAFT_39659 [Dissoconium aciculare CBS 342.82]|uniref:Uncharacterized protein n=1 Tax=Dissoconium aciculare CBS 342.82 TaxID=1314786 RepID=A0A6J3LYF4_9PEZI|nr:uncharacterized protein K489DRAFT_39659 [Dissoconium aciculare CBS 342.82]KAF1820678.1 hypothetical protein K489DRAFT_39659 [Dissoconium aciculare CBS 342.82]